MFSEIDEKKVRIALIQELKLYKALKVKVENLKEQEAHGATGLFTSLRNQEIFNVLKVRQIDRALEYSLDEIEQDIIRMKYLLEEIESELSNDFFDQVDGTAIAALFEGCYLMLNKGNSNLYLFEDGLEYRLLDVDFEIFLQKYIDSKGNAFWE